MADALHDKLNDFVKWSRKAFARDAEGDAEDALSNLRKAGEAACKVILLHKLPVKRAEAIITECIGLRDLVRAIVQHGDMDQRSLLPFDAIRAYGNDGAHDSKVDLNEVRTGIGTLHSLVRWLYSTRLKLNVPPELDAYLHGKTSVTKVSSAEEAMRQAEEVRALITLKSKELEQRSERQIDALKEEARADTKDSFERIERMITELRAQKPVVVEVPAPAPQVATVPWRWVAPVALFVAIGIAAVFFFTRPPPTVAREAPIAIAAITVPPGGINVLLLPFAVLQDDPNVRMNFEEALKSKMEQHIQSLGLPVKVIVGTNPNNRSFTVQEAAAEAERQHARLVIYGNLFEPTTTDSGRVAPSYLLARLNGVEEDHIDLGNFRTLTDSTVLRAQAALLFLLYQALANQLVTDGRLSQALAVLYEARPITAKQCYLCTQFRAYCHFQLLDFPSALREGQKCLQEKPNDPYLIGFIGNVLKASGDLPAARKYLERAIALTPNEAPLLLDYADLIVDTENPKNQLNSKAVGLVRKALSIDSTMARGWLFLGLSAFANERWSEAQAHLEKSRRCENSEPIAAVRLAEVLAFHANEPERAVQLVSEVLRTDSTDVGALTLLAEIHTRTTLRDPALAAYLYGKARTLAPGAGLQALIGEGIAAGQQGDRTRALERFRTALALDSNNTWLLNQVAELFQRAGQESEAIQYLERALRIDPLDHMVNCNLAEILTFGAPANRSTERANICFATAMRTDPFDTLMIERYSLFRVQAGDMQGAEQLIEKLRRLDPSNFVANKYSGVFAGQRGELAQARTYYERAMRTTPNDPFVLASLAQVLLELSPRNSAQSLTLAKRSVEIYANPGNLAILSMILIANGDAHQGAEMYRKAKAIDPNFQDTAVEEALKFNGY